MSITINWVPPSNNSVGSVLVYRSNDSTSEQLGSRTIIATVAAKSGATWVTSYTDASGTNDNFYRVQFWDGVGSSEISDPIGTEYNELLCSFDDVVRLAHIQNSDVGSEQLYYAIKDATDTVFYDMGDPIKKTIISLDSTAGVEGQVYSFGGDLGPVYQVREVYVDSSDGRLVSNSDYQVDYTNGLIKFTDSFINTWQGNNIILHWVPMTQHILIKNMAALDIIEGQLLFSGPNVQSPHVNKLTRKIEEIKDAIRPKGLFSTKSKDILTDYDTVAQKIDRTSIYFNY